MCLPKKSSGEEKSKCRQQPFNSKSIYCRNQICKLNSSKITLRRENANYEVSGISHGACFSSNETPYINVATLMDSINEQIRSDISKQPRRLPQLANSNEVQLGQVSARGSISNSNTITNPIHFLQNICPIIVKNNENGQPECEGRQRRINGTFNAILLSNCPDLKVRTNKMFCNSSGQVFDIFCSVLPDNGTSITLADAQDLCLKKIETELITEEDIGETNVEAVTETRSVIDEATPIKEDVVVVESTIKQEVNIPQDLRELNLNC